jgi:Tfp pilus assembly protein PilF
LTKSKSEILQGWKEIAAYVSRDERTVKRWEKQRGLPVRRMPGSGRANVYAVVADVDAWLSTTPATAEPMQADDADGGEDELSQSEIGPEAGGLDRASLREVVPAAEPAGAVPSAHLKSSQGWWKPVAIAAGFVILAAAAVFVLRAAHPHPTAQQTSDTASRAGQVAARATYSSPVPGVDELYLRGVYSYEKRTPESLNVALQCFNSAIEKDPKYAPAYAGLANTYNLLREYSVMPAADVFSKARAASERAIALDPKLPQAHAALGFTLFFGYWETAQAEQEFKTAIALDPSASLAHSWYGSILTHEARYTEALEQLDVAYRLQPSSAAIASSRAFALGLSGHRDEGAALLQEMIDQDRDVSSAHLRLAFLSLVSPREIPQYLDANRRQAEIIHSKDYLALFALAERVYRSRGETAMWQAIIREERLRHPSGPTRRVADAEAALGENDAAFADIETMVKQRELNMIGLRMNPLFAGLRSDPRFERIAQEIGLPPVK